MSVVYKTKKHMTPAAAAAPYPHPHPQPNTPLKSHFSEKTQDAKIKKNNYTMSMGVHRKEFLLL